jgi:hypothetical protein
VRAIVAAEQLQYIPWWAGYLIIGLLYSVFVFLSEEDRPSIFSRQNKRSRTQILLIHISFLGLLFLVMRTFAHIAGYLPHWFTDEYDMGEGGLSVANLLSFIGAALLAGYEKHVLFQGTTESRTE